MGKIYAASSTKKPKRFYPSYILWFLLGMLLPPVGFFLYLYGRSHYRRWRKALLFGIIFGVIVTIAFYAFYYVKFILPTMRPVMYWDV